MSAAHREREEAALLPRIITTDPLRDGLFTHRDVTPDEIDEDPPTDADAVVHITDDGITTSGAVIVLDERT